MEQATWVKYEQAKQMLGCSKTKFFELIKVGVLNTRKVGGFFVVEVAGIEKYLADKPKRRTYLDTLDEINKGVRDA